MHVVARRILRAGGIYFALVFAAGFALGAIRVLWVVPRAGVRAAELMEAPIMLAVVLVAARWVVRRRSIPRSPPQRLAMGLVALALLLAAECSVVLWVQGRSVGEYLAGRDPVAGTAYAIMLVIFAVMPLLVARN